MLIDELLEKNGETGKRVPPEIVSYIEATCADHGYSFQAAREVKDLKDEYYVIQIYGGNNGHSDWVSYFGNLKNLMEHFINDGYSAWCIQLKNDCPDDVHDVFIGLEPDVELYNEKLRSKLK